MPAHPLGQAGPGALAGGLKAGQAGILHRGGGRRLLIGLGTLST